MLTWEDDVEVHALRKRGWSISAIARHTGFDRKTVRYAEIGITHLMPYRSLCRTGGLAVRPSR